jgi:hypothetical protein
MSSNASVVSASGGYDWPLDAVVSLEAAPNQMGHASRPSALLVAVSLCQHRLATGARASKRVKAAGAA